MTKRYFNWKLVVVLILGLMVLAATAFGLRHWQRGRRAYQGLSLGNKAFSEGRWQEAANQLGRYLSIVPDDVPVLLNYAEAQLNIRPLRSGDIQQATAAYRTVLRLMPGHTEAAVRLSQIYLGIRMPGEAEEVAVRALQSARSPELQNTLAIALAYQRKFAEAAAELKNIIRDYPEYIQAYDVLGQLVEQRPEDFNMSPQLWFDAAVKNAPSSAQAYVIRGAYYLRQDQKDKAMADFAEAEKQNFDDPNVQLQLAEQLVNAGDLQQAQKQLEIVAGRESSSQMLWRIWAKLAIRSGSETMMFNVAERGLKELSSQPWDFMQFAAELYLRAGRLDKATDCISQLHQKDIAHPMTAFLDGLLAEANGQGYQAVECWQKALDMGGDPANLRIAIANVLSKLGNTQSAIKQLRILVSEQPNLVKARVDLARLLGETGRWAESLEHSIAAVKLSPQDPNAFFVYVLARMHSAAAEAGGYGPQTGDNIKESLRKLDVMTGGAIDVQILESQLAIRQDDIAGAEDLVGRLKSKYPEDDRVVLAEADLLAAQGRTDEAVTMLTKAVDKSPDSIVLVRALAQLLTTRGERQNCVDMLNRAMIQSRQSFTQKRLGLLLAGLYSVSNEQQKRCELLTRLSAQFPEDVPLLRSMLTCPTILKDSPGAQNLVDKIRTIEGQKGWQWRYEQAKVWFGRDDFKDNYPQVVLLLKENLLDNPDDQASRMLLAAAYEKAVETRLAIATYEEAVSRSPDDVRVVVAAAGALYKVKEYDRADQILKRAAENKLQHPELKQLQLQSSIRRGDLDSAGSILEDILAADPNNRSAGLSMALLKIQQGRLDDAEDILDALSASEPNSLSVATAQVELNLRRGGNAEAIELCNNLVQRLNDASAMVLRGRTYAILGQNSNAVADFEKAASIEPDNVDVLLARSDFYRSIDRLDQAVADIQRALILDPNNLQTQKRAVLLYLASADSARQRQGETLLESALKTSPQDVDLRLYKANLLVLRNTAPALDEARAILKSITEQMPMSSNAWRLLAEIAIRQGHSAEAIDITLRGLVYRPNDKSLLLLRSKLEGARSPLLAVPTLRALREIDPNDPEPTACLAEAYTAGGEYDNAVELLEAQLRLPNSSDAERRLKIALAAALHKAARQSEAEEIFDALQKSMPDDPTPLLTQVRLLKDGRLWGQIDQKVTMWWEAHPNDVNVPLIVANELAAVGDNEPRRTAEDLFNRILQRQPDSHKATYSLAQLLQTGGRFGEATDLYHRILTVDPNNVIAINNLAWILCENRSQYQQALELAQTGLDKAPDYVDLLDTHGVAYYRLGRFEPAIEDLTRCVNLYPANSPSLTASYFHLARALAKLGQTSRASDVLRKAFDLNSTIGGLTDADIVEARQLLEKLSEGGN